MWIILLVLFISKVSLTIPMDYEAINNDLEVVWDFLSTTEKKDFILNLYNARNSVNFSMENTQYKNAKHYSGDIKKLPKDAVKIWRNENEDMINIRKGAKVKRFSLQDCKGFVSEKAGSGNLPSKEHL